MAVSRVKLHMRRLPATSTTHQIFAWFLILSTVVFLGYRLIWSDSGKQSDECVGNREESHLCHRSIAGAIAEEHGIPAALAYAHGVEERENMSFASIHAILHPVGRSAYHKAGSLESALAFISPPEVDSTFDFTLDGYRHGVYQGFLEEDPSSRAFVELAHTACRKYFNTATIEAIPGVRDKVDARECFHGIGHAAMHVLGNRVPSALAWCNELTYEWMKRRCAYGVFMENVYLYSSVYERGEPHPSVSGNTFLPLCQGFADEIWRSQCFIFAGQAFFEAERNNRNGRDNLLGAFAECDRVEERYYDLCVARLAVHMVPAVFRGDFRGMIASCNMARPSHINNCLLSVARGIRNGSAGPSNKFVPFCDLVGEALRGECRLMQEDPERLHMVRG